MKKGSFTRCTVFAPNRRWSYTETSRVWRTPGNSVNAVFSFFFLPFHFFFPFPLTRTAGCLSVRQRKTRVWARWWGRVVKGREGAALWRGRGGEGAWRCRGRAVALRPPRRQHVREWGHEPASECSDSGCACMKHDFQQRAHGTLGQVVEIQVPQWIQAVCR